MVTDQGVHALSEVSLPDPIRIGFSLPEQALEPGYFLALLPLTIFLQVEHGDSYLKGGPDVQTTNVRLVPAVTGVTLWRT